MIVKIWQASHIVSIENHIHIGMKVVLDIEKFTNSKTIKCEINNKIQSAKSCMKMIHCNNCLY